MTARLKTAAALALVLCACLAAPSAAGATIVGCSKIGFEPGQPDPNRCAEITTPDPAPSAPPAATPSPAPAPVKPTPAPSARPASPAANSNASADNALTIGGDTARSTVAVFPAPSTAAVPQAQNCLVTRSTAGGAGWNLIQGATSEQYSEPVCVLQWLATTATDPAERAALRAEIVRRLGGAK